MYILYMFIYENLNLTPQKFTLYFFIKWHSFVISTAIITVCTY